MTETNRIEFKRELTDKLDIEKEVIAFLNYREGGIIYIGPRWGAPSTHPQCQTTRAQQ